MAKLKCLPPEITITTKGERDIFKIKAKITAVGSIGATLELELEQHVGQSKAILRANGMVRIEAKHIQKEVDEKTFYETYPRKFYRSLTPKGNDRLYFENTRILFTPVLKFYLDWMNRDPKIAKVLGDLEAPQRIGENPYNHLD